MASVEEKTAEAYVAKAKEARAKFIDLIKKQEEFAKRNPAAYLRKVRFLAYLGYSYVIVVFLVLLAIVAGLAWAIYTGHFNLAIIKILLITAPVLYVVARSLYVKLDKPEGVVLTRNDAPELFREVDSISQQLGSIRFDKIIIHDDLNAYASQIPRFGIIGPTRNYLVLGLPLLLTLSPNEARFVIAHEFGHFAGGHSRFGGWIYRINRTWASLQANLDSGGGSWLFEKFFDWFEPLFSATSFALRRQNEFEADAAAAKVAGPEAARALMRFSFVIPHLQDSFWKPLYERAKDEPEPPREALSGLVGIAKSPIQRERVREKLVEALNEETSYDDTHPALKERLTALGLDVQNVDRWADELALGNEQSAAEVFLGRNLDAIVTRVNALAVQQMSAGWKDYHDQFKEWIAEFTKLQVQRDAMPLTRDEETRYVSLMRRVFDDQQAKVWAEKALERFPNDPQFLALYGDILLDLNEGAGVEYLKRAMELKPEYESAGYLMIVGYYQRTGQKDAATSAEEELLNARIIDSYAKQQALNLTVSDTFVPHELKADELQQMQLELALCGEVGEAYVVRKIVHAKKDRAYSVMILLPRTVMGMQKTNYQEIVDEAAQKVSTLNEFLVSAPAEAKAWRNRLEQIPDALVYKRG